MSDFDGNKYPFNIEAILKSRGDFRGLLEIDKAIQSPSIKDDLVASMVTGIVKKLIEGSKVDERK